MPLYRYTGELRPAIFAGLSVDGHTVVLYPDGIVELDDDPGTPLLVPVEAPQEAPAEPVAATATPEDVAALEAKVAADEAALAAASAPEPPAAA